MNNLLKFDPEPFDFEASTAGLPPGLAFSDRESEQEDEFESRQGRGGGRFTRGALSGSSSAPKRLGTSYRGSPSGAGKQQWPGGKQRGPGKSRGPGGQPWGAKPGATPGPWRWGGSRYRRPYFVAGGVDLGPSLADGVSEHVRWVQTCLNRFLGLTIPMDGIMTARTRAALRTFQERRGLPINGLMGPETDTALRDACGAAQAPAPVGGSPPTDSPSGPPPAGPPPAGPPPSADAEPMPPPPDQPTGELGPWARFEVETGMPVMASTLPERIVAIAKQELAHWNNGTIKEIDPKNLDVLRDYWKTGAGVNYTAAQLASPAFQSSHPWSAAFISWVMRKAGAGPDFKYNASHSVYTAAAKNNRLQGNTNPFKAYRVSEMPPRVGDLICKARAGSGATYENIQPGMTTHCDIVIGKHPDGLEVVGGNVSNSVSRGGGRVKVDKAGHLTDPNYFGVIRIDAKQPAIPPMPHTPMPLGPMPGTAPASITSGFEVSGPVGKSLSCMRAARLKGRQVKFLVRYLRDLTPVEARHISDAGLTIVSCWELGQPTKLAYFTRARGSLDGSRAFARANAAKQPANTPIYFAVDYDAYKSQDKAAVLDYFEGIREAHKTYATSGKTPYAIGIYGSGCILSLAKKQGVATYFWQAFAPGWCDNRKLWQGGNLHTFALDTPPICGRRLGRVEGWGNEGGWSLRPAVPVIGPVPGPTPGPGTMPPTPTPPNPQPRSPIAGAPKLLKRETTPPGTTAYFDIDLKITDKFGIVAPPMTGVFVPAGYAPNGPVDIVLYLHGHKGGDMRKLGIDQYWNGQRFPYGALRERFIDSGRTAFFVAPSLGSRSEGGRLLEPGGLDTFLAAVLAGMRANGIGGARLVLGNLILACHSGGGAPMRRLSGGTGAAVAKLRECWGFDCTYNGGDDTYWAGWARKNPNGKCYFYYIRGSQTARLSESLRALKVSNAIVLPSKDPRHNYIPITYWAERLSGAGFLNAGSGGGATPTPPTAPAPSPLAETEPADLKSLTRPEFIAFVGRHAREAMTATGVPASVTVAQAILESGWGKHTIRDAKNLFGIKGKGPAGSVRTPTKEFRNGKWVTEDANFAKYDSFAQSITEHAHFLLRNKRYAPAFKVKEDADAFAREIHKAGYATGPNYATELIALMKKHDLYRFDR
jgi:hypothetical protein